MDNKEFAALADGMIRLKKTKLYVEIISEGLTILLDSVSIILNAFISMRSVFTRSQMEIYSQNKAGKSQIEIAREINKSQQYVSKTLNGIKAENLEVLEEKLYRIIAYGIDQRNTD
jgi:DNA-binding CsgD family transcriptional regulator